MSTPAVRSTSHHGTIRSSTKGHRANRLPRMRRSLAVIPRRLSLLVMWLLWPAVTYAEQSDSLRLFGAWRWIQSAGGFSGLRATPKACGCERLLSLERSGHYELVEQDSAHEYVLCAGSFTVQPRIQLDGEGRAARTFWVSFQGWWYGSRLISPLASSELGRTPSPRTQAGRQDL